MVDRAALVDLSAVDHVQGVQNADFGHRYQKRCVIGYRLTLLSCGIVPSKACGFGNSLTSNWGSLMTIR